MVNRKAMLLASAISMMSVQAIAADEGINSGGLEEIVVTAQRRAENLQRVPIAITAVTGETLASSGIQDVANLPAVAPGLNITTQGSGNLLFFLRGIGSSNGSVGDEPSIATYVDGFYIAEAPTALLNLSGIERIEVLKGPQGTLYGRNASGGLIGVTTRDPGRTTTATAGLSYSNYDTITGTFYGATPLSDKLAANVSAYYNKQHKGWGRNLTTGAETNRTRSFAMRGKLKFEPSDSTKITLSGDYSDYDTGVGATRIIYPGPISFPTSTGTISFPGVSGFGGAKQLGSIYDSTANYGNRSVGNSWAAGLRIDQDLDSVRIVSLSGYRKNDKTAFFDQEASPTPAVNANINQSSEQYSQEIQILSSQESAIHWIAGAYFFQYNTRYDPLQIYGLAFGTAQRFIYNEQRTRSLATFAQATIDLTDDTHLTLGGRYSWDKRKADGQLLVNNVTVAGQVHASQKSDRPTWRAALDHQVNPDLLVYGTYSRGFKSGVFNLITLSPVPVKDETLDAFEVGFKSEVLEHTFRFNAAAFYYKYKNLQLQKYQVGGSVLTNAARAELYGVDLEAVIAPVRNFTIRAGMSLLHTEYKKFGDAPFEYLAGTVTCPSPGVVIPTGNAPTGGNIVCSGDAKGNHLSRAPAVTANIGVDYKLPTSIGDVAFNVNFYFSDKYFWAPDNFYEQKSYTLLNAQIALDLNSNVRLKVFGSNLLDAQYLAGQNGGSLGTNAIAAAPRTYGAGVEFKF